MDLGCQLVDSIESDRMMVANMVAGVVGVVVVVADGCSCMALVALGELQLKPNTKIRRMLSFCLVV